MDFDGEYDEEFDDPSEDLDSELKSHENKDPDADDIANNSSDPLNISDPKSAYFLLSDDAQDEINGEDKSRMKCLSCGHKFIGEIYDDCPECYSTDTEELISRTTDDEWYPM